MTLEEEKQMHFLNFKTNKSIKIKTRFCVLYITLLHRREREREKIRNKKQLLFFHLSFLIISIS